jgi:predicted GNAT family acetyltransferase
MRILHYQETGPFLDRAQAFLLRAEAENNMFLGMGARELDAGCYLATVEDGEEILACAVRTPPYGLVITRMEERAVDALIDDVVRKYEMVPTVLGPETTVTTFAERWGRRMGTRTRRIMRMRLFEARRVQAPCPPPSGHLRPAHKSELRVITAWVLAFHEEARTRDPLDAERTTHEDLANQRLYVWDDRGVVSIAKWAGRTQRSARIGLAYTPPRYRGRGYASALVAGLTQRLLDEGLVFCCINADVANPTTNKIYPAIGYRHVCDTSNIDLNARTQSVAAPGG